MSKFFSKEHFIIDVVSVLLAIVLAYFATKLIVGLYFTFWEDRLVGAAALGFLAGAVGLLLIPITFLASLLALVGTYIIVFVRKRV